MWRFALSRRWWFGHLLVLTFCAVFIWLGNWQWDRSQTPTGDWQNLGYALQWPLFAVVLLAAWVRFLWLEQPRIPETPAPTPPPTERPVPHQPIREEEPDDELAAYNAYLARLAEQEQR